LTLLRSVQREIIYPCLSVHLLCFTFHNFQIVLTEDLACAWHFGNSLITLIYLSFMNIRGSRYPILLFINKKVLPSTPSSSNRHPTLTRRTKSNVLLPHIDSPNKPSQTLVQQSPTMSAPSLGNASPHSTYPHHRVHLVPGRFHAIRLICNSSIRKLNPLCCDQGNDSPLLG